MRMIKWGLLVGLIGMMVGCGSEAPQVPKDQARVIHTVYIDRPGTADGLYFNIIKVYGKCILYGYNVGMIEISPEGCN